MKLQGSLEIKSVTTAGLRVNEGLNASYITENVQLNKYSKKYQHYKTTSERIVTLPEEETIPVGWSVVIFNHKDSSANIKTQSVSGEFYKILKPSKTVTYVLVSKDAGNIIWSVVESGSGGSTVVFRTWNGFDDTDTPDTPETPEIPDEPEVVEPVTYTLTINPTTEDATLEFLTDVGVTNGNSKVVDSGTSVSFKVYKTGYVTYENTVVVTEDKVIDVALTKVQHSVTIEPNPEGATVKWTYPDSSTQINKTISVDYGTELSYEVSMEGYESTNGSVTVSQDSVISVTLTRLIEYATLTINTVPANATVVLTLPDASTISAKSATVLAGESISYVVSADGYISKSGSVLCDATKTITITLDVEQTDPEPEQNESAGGDGNAENQQNPGTTVANDVYYVYSNGGYDYSEGAYPTRLMLKTTSPVIGDVAYYFRDSTLYAFGTVTEITEDGVSVSDYDGVLRSTNLKYNTDTAAYKFYDMAVYTPMHTWDTMVTYAYVLGQPAVGSYLYHAYSTPVGTGVYIAYKSSVYIESIGLNKYGETLYNTSGGGSLYASEGTVSLLQGESV